MSVGTRDAAREIRHFELAGGQHDAHRVTAGGGHPLQLVEGVEELGRPLGQELRCEYLAEGAVVGTPAELDQLAQQHRFVDLPLSAAAHQPPAREPSVQDEVAHALRVADGVCDGRGRTLGEAEQRKALELHGVDHRLEVAHPGLEGNLGGIAVGEAAATRVEAHQRVAARQALDPVAPDGAAPVVLEVREPVGRLHERRAAAGRGVGKPHAVGAGAEAQVLAITHGIIILQCRSTCSSRTCSCPPMPRPSCAPCACPPSSAGSRAPTSSAAARARRWNAWLRRMGSPPRYR
jgi:hypothetical protein